MSRNRGDFQRGTGSRPDRLTVRPALSVLCVLSYTQKMQSSCDRIYLQNRIQSHLVMNGTDLLLDAKIYK